MTQCLIRRSAIGIAFLMLSLGSHQALAQSSALTPEIANAEQAYLLLDHVRDMSATKKSAFQSELSKKALHEYGSIQRQRSYLKGSSVRASIDPQDDMLILDVIGNVIPKSSEFLPIDLEDDVDSVAKALMFHFDGKVYIAGYKVRFNGKPQEELFPEPLPPKTSGASPRVSPTAEPKKTVVVSASHGYFKTYGAGANNYFWDFQRPFVNNVREDLLTPFQAQYLDLYLATRSDVLVEFARSQSSAAFPNPDNLAAEWWQMAATYNLAERYPDLPEMWGHYRNTTQAKRDEKSDWYARPRFANHLNADAIISLHTNGNDNSAVRGLETWAYNGRTEDLALGNSILCYTKEIIRAQEGYEDFKVASYTRQAGHAENGQATRSAIIVETAYHSNPDDALALEDDVFLEAAMKGVEKGYRLYRESKPCKPFKILSIANASGNNGTKVPVVAKTEGFPQATVKVDVEITSCPSIYTCTGAQGRVTTATADGFSWNFGCNSSASTPTSTVGVRTVFYDADGVKTGFKDSSVTCTKRTSGSTMHASGSDDQDVAASATIRI